MARADRSSRKPRKRAARPGGRSALARWSAWGALVLCVVAVLAVPVYRLLWRRAETNQLQRGMALTPEVGCLACHQQTGGGLRWRHDGAPPASLEAARDALLNGRDPAPGMPAAMPAFGGRVRAAEWQALLMAVLAREAMVGVPDDPELAAGYDIASDHGCFGCHGVLGCGGVVNRGSLAGRIPGWYGSAFEAGAGSAAGTVELLRSGTRARRLPVPGIPGPVLAMPSFDSRMDSTEMQLVARYVEWLRDDPPRYR